MRRLHTWTSAAREQREDDGGADNNRGVGAIARIATTSSQIAQRDNRTDAGEAPDKDDRAGQSLAGPRAVAKERGEGQLDHADRTIGLARVNSGERCKVRYRSNDETDDEGPKRGDGRGGAARVGSTGEERFKTRNVGQDRAAEVRYGFGQAKRRSTAVVRDRCCKAAAGCASAEMFVDHARSENERLTVDRCGEFVSNFDASSEVVHVCLVVAKQQGVPVYIAS